MSLAVHSRRNSLKNFAVYDFALLTCCGDPWATNVADPHHCGVCTLDIAIC